MKACSWSQGRYMKRIFDQRFLFSLRLSKCKECVCHWTKSCLDASSILCVITVPPATEAEACWLHGLVKFQALVYDILPPTTAVIDYALGRRQLSASEQFFVVAQVAVSLRRNSNYIRFFVVVVVCFVFVTAHVAFASTNKTQIVWIEMELSFSPFLLGADALHVYVRAWTLFLP